MRRPRLRRPPRSPTPARPAQPALPGPPSPAAVAQGHVLHARLKQARDHTAFLRGAAGPWPAVSASPVLSALGLPFALCLPLPRPPLHLGAPATLRSVVAM